MEDAMSGRAKSHRSWRQPLLAGIALALVSGVMGAGPVAAHTFTRNDGNDSPGKLDLRSVSVSHTSTAVVHKVRTYEAWTPRSLGNDSFFLIQIDKNNTVEGVYERCAFIFYTTRLRGSLTNCGSQFIRYLPVSKLSGAVAKITIPKSQTGNVYWWAGASRWDGPAPCRRGCIDFTPNNFPDMIHDMIPPVVTLNTTPLRVWESSSTAEFTFPFSVTDAHTGIQSWVVQRREVGSASWAAISQGSSGGSKNPEITGVEGTRFDYRVVARDRQGNQRISPSRRVYIPTDDDDPTIAAGFSVAPMPVPETDAFGGSYSEMAATDVFTYVFGNPGDCLFELIGPRTGTWTVGVTANAADQGDITSDGTGGPREVLYSSTSCDTTFEFTVESGTGFGIDAVLG
jgi:hypothetical protein